MSSSEEKIWKFHEHVKDYRKVSQDNQKNQKVDMKEDTTFLGVHGKKKIFIENNAKHIFICGTTGSGKTVALSNFIESIFKYDYPALIVDGKGDIDEGSMFDYVGKFKEKYPTKKVYIVDLNNPHTCDKYNPFYCADYKNPTVMKDMLISMTDWSEEHYKLNASRYIQKVLFMMIENEVELSFESIIDNLSISSFTRLSMALQKQNKITKQVHLDNVKMAESVAKIIEGTIARFSLLIESDIKDIFHSSTISNSSNNLDYQEKVIDIPMALNENAIILFVLNPLIYPEISRLFGRLITIDAKQGVSRLFHKRFSRTFYIFDELSIYASKELLLLVNLSRSANITSILATQSLSDLDSIDEALRKQVIESCNNYLVLRQNEPSNAEIWANTIGTRNTMNVTYQIKNEQSKTDTTGLGSARATREYLYHPDMIKNLKLGEAIFISKDKGVHYKLKVNKPNF